MKKRSNVKVINDIPQPPDLKKHTECCPPLKEIWEWIRPSLLYGKLLGFQGNFNQRLKNKDNKASKLKADVDEVKNIILSNGNNLMKPKLVYQFFKCYSNDNSIHILRNNTLTDTNNTSIMKTFTFPRQQKPDYLCISDYVNPYSDYIALFVVSAGNYIKETADEWQSEGKFKHSIILQSIALATAEALAEYLHKYIRKLWGINDDSLSVKEMLQNKYRGLRYSFGYPSTPDLSQQQIIWDLLKPDELGIHLTDGYMMEPEASISALVLHHPDAKYFSVLEKM